MKTEVKVAIIGGLVTIIVAIVTGFFGLLGSTSEKKAVEPQPVTQPAQSSKTTVVNGNNNTTVGDINAAGNVSLSTSSKEK